MLKIVTQIGVVVGAAYANSYICEKAVQAGIDGKIKSKTAERITTASSLATLVVMFSSGSIAKKAISRVAGKTAEVVIESVI